MIDKIYSLIEKLDRKNQLYSLKKHKNVSFPSEIKLGIGNKFTLYLNLQNVTIGKGFDIRNHLHFIVGNSATLEIGDNVFMNNFCSINCLQEITIGENTLFGENVKIYDHNHAYESSENSLKVSHSEFTKAPVKIGKNCWLGSNVTILKGVTIGDNCIIGAGCTIYKDIAPNTTVLNSQNLILKPH